MNYCITFVVLSFLSASLQVQPPDALLSRANTLIGQRRFGEAEVAARDYIGSHPDSADGHFLLGYILFLQARAKESLAECTEGAKYRVPSPRDLKVVASDYVVLGDFPDADKWYTKLLEWTPGDSQAWYDLGRTKYNENRFDEAVTAFQHVLALDAKNVKAEDNLGLSLAALGRNDEAIKAYKRAITLQQNEVSKNPGPYLDFGSLLVEDNQTAEALPLLSEALAIAPADFQVHRELGKAYLHQNELNKAASELEKAIELAPRNAPLHFMLAQVYRKQGLMDKAKAETERYTALK